MMSEDQGSGRPAGGDAGDTDEKPEAPSLSIYDGDQLVAWASGGVDESPPDDLLSAAPSPSGEPTVLGWSAPSPEYVLTAPGDFAAPEDPDRKVSGPKTVPEKTNKPGKTTKTKATTPSLWGEDAFGGRLCTCHKVCTCNLVCTCEAVCRCVGDTCSCVGDTCSCVGDTCGCVGNCPCQVV
jgi:hypothetical protein